MDKYVNSVLVKEEKRFEDYSLPERACAILIMWCAIAFYSYLVYCWAVYGISWMYSRIGGK